MKKDGFYKEIRSQIINEDFRGALTRQEAVSMLPCLFLDIQPHHLVLDMCSSPAACFPTLHENAGGGPQKEKLQFDRILADVPCSGDGTMRKNVDVWRSWNAGGGHSMHPIQAVIATVLSQQKGRVEIVDPPELPGLKWSKGKSSWLVPSPPAKVCPLTEDTSAPNAPAGSRITFFRAFDEVPEEFHHRIRPTMFPPLGADSMSLEKCVRVLPHHNNTGGFFVCCLRKVAELDASQIFISNKSKVRVAAEERQHDRRNSRGCGGPRPTSKSAFNDSPDPPSRTEGSGTSSEATNPVEPEPNPLLDGTLLPEELNTNTQPAAASGSLENIAERTSTAPSASEEGSLYALAAAASKPGSLFHLLLPTNCDAEGSRVLQMIFDFFGLDERTPLLAGDLRDPRNVESLDPDLLFRRVHSQKKMFLLSKSLAGLVKTCYGTPGARCCKVLAHAQSRRGELCQQLDGLLRSKIKWVHAGATVLVKHCETKTGEEQGLGAQGWRVPQEGAALMATFMRRRIVFVSLLVGRLLLLPEARVVRLSQLLYFEGCKQVLNLASCRDKDGSIEAGGVVCIICPTSVVSVEDTVREDAHAKEGTPELDEETRLLARKYPIRENPSFSAIADSLCVACMLTRGGNLHAYMNKNEAKALAFHLFSMPEELTTACNDA
ncbi:Nol1/NOP2/sun family methyltransferase, related, related [Eimeria mitis]|uniref:Nol1/NOP2/sun family methyltransferase, related, related n=1 Tax=Eimeria mitis TaxID=44415 RepID=U6JMX8_9EIME|nr:Nol1/NOP2/sun family methyltransferase, related, related [Eimeria mitis]CDJ26854.1 Nol1/NOP2/sun family methyltransferase, related, related [Eimeria mitis]